MESRNNSTYFPLIRRRFGCKRVLFDFCWIFFFIKVFFFLTPISNFIVLKTDQSNEINEVNKLT
jgi:hypothetical protein